MRYQQLRTRMRESIPQKNIPVVLQSFTQVHESKLPTLSPPTVLLLLHHPQTGDFNGLQVLPVLNCKKCCILG